MLKVLKITALFCFFLLLPFASQAAGKLEVGLSQSRILSYYGVERVAVANPDIADVVVVSGSEILVVGKAPGVTSLHVWSKYGRDSYEIEVAADNVPLAEELQRILGYPDIKVSKIDKTLILEGTVSDQYQKARAEKVAGAYGDRVVNLLELTQPIQVKIEAKIVEVNREKVDNLGIKWGNDISSPGAFIFGQGTNYQAGNSRSFNNYYNVIGQLDALIKNGSAKILSQPNLVTLSGDKANILVGGQIPVPVSTQNGQIIVEWKDYGIKLDISPEVTGERLINSKVKAEVSSLDWNSTHRIAISQSLSIPPIKMRKAEAAIALTSGQTMAIGGLIASEMTQDVYKLPLLGDLPIIGNLFKSTSFNRSETELLILITPTIVDPVQYAPGQTEEMKHFTQEDPWGGNRDDGKNKSSGR